MQMLQWSREEGKPEALCVYDRHLMCPALLKACYHSLGAEKGKEREQCIKTLSTPEVAQVGLDTDSCLIDRDKGENTL